MATPPPHKAIEDGQGPTDDGKEQKPITEQEAEEQEEDMVQEWGELKVKLQKTTKNVGELSNEATTVRELCKARPS